LNLWRNKLKLQLLSLSIKTVGFVPRTIINEAIYEKAKNGLIQLQSQGTAANKLKAIMASYKHGAKKVSQIFDIDITSIHKWTVKLEKDGYKALINKAKHRGGIKLIQIHKDKIKKWLEQDPNYSIDQMHEKLENYFDLDVSRSTVHRAMKSVGFSYITPRQNHYKQDKKGSFSK
jgi:transposase